MKNLNILVLGGYGFFGSRIVTLLARERGLTVWVAGRDPLSAQVLIDRFQHDTAIQANLIAVQMDANAPDLAKQLQHLSIQLVIHTCGPFQGQDYAVARSCLDAGCHYIDLADGREFVHGIGTLHSLAQQRGLMVCSGASSVCGISGAVVDAAAKQLAALHDVSIAISLGNQTERGLATVRGILSYCGEAIPRFEQGRMRDVVGWGTAQRILYTAPIGSRWVSDCDVPDTQVLPTRYPELRSVRCRAGLELTLMHWGMVVLALLRHWRLVPNWAGRAGILKWLSEKLWAFGTPDGAMSVQVIGQDKARKTKQLHWELHGLDGDGPYVPALCSVAMVKRLLQTGRLPPGAWPAPAGLTLDEIMKSAQGLSISAQWRCGDST